MSVLAVVSGLVALTLACFSARRLALVAGALLPPRRAPEEPEPPPSVTLLVPARNEGPGLAGVLGAIDRLTYAPGSLFVVVVDDASTDDTGAQLDRWSRDRPRTLALHQAEQSGKSGALNAAIAAAPESELVAVCDADLRPRPDWLQRLASSFGEEDVGAAAGYLAPCNPTAGIVARYAALETWTHQLVTSAGKDRLDLNPPLLGASLYRREALEGLGGFRASGPGEDIHATVSLTRQGWRTRFVREAVADNTLVHGWRDYWHQHIRWARNLFTAGGASPTPGRPAPPRSAAPLRRRLESRLTRTGYADRLAFAAAAALASGSSLSPWFPLGYAAITLGEASVATVRAGESGRLHRYLGAVFLVFPIDLAASLTAAVAQLIRRPRTWQAARRAERATERLAGLG